ncbi:MAG: hypothetical protein RIC89_04050 [Pseudomonadales bacterium]
MSAKVPTQKTSEPSAQSSSTSALRCAADGRFIAYHAKSGEPLWQVPVSSGVIAGPSTYEIDGKSPMPEVPASSPSRGSTLVSGYEYEEADVEDARKIAAFIQHTADSVQRGNAEAQDEANDQ